MQQQAPPNNDVDPSYVREVFTKFIADILK